MNLEDKDGIISDILHEQLRSDEEYLARIERQIKEETEDHEQRIARLNEKAAPVRRNVEALRKIFDEDE